MLKLNSMIETLDAISKKALNSPLFLFFFTLVTILGFYASQFLSLDLFLANVGSSALHWLNVISDNTKNINDWPTGTRNIYKSLPMQIYSYFFNHTDIALTSLIKIYIFIEILAVCTAFFFLHRSLSTKKNNILAVVYVLIVALTSYQFMNLARFGWPFYWGLYYGLAVAFRIFGILFIIKNKPWAATITLSIAVMIHPIMAGIAIFSGLALILFKGIKTIRSYVIPFITMSIPLFCWIYIMYVGDTIFVGTIPTDSYIFLTKLFQSHWYPMISGAFNSLQFVHLLPTISIMMLYVMISLTNQGAKSTSSEIHIIILSSALLTTLGVLASFSDNVFLIKLSLHRASNFMVAIALIPISIKLWNDIFNAKILFRCIALYLILSPFIDYRMPGFALFFTLIYATQLIIEVIEAGSSKKIFVVFVIWFTGLFALIFSAAPDYYTKIIEPSNDGIKLIAILSVLLIIIKYFFSDKLKYLMNNVKVIFLIVLSFFVIRENIDRTSNYRSEFSAAIYDIQIWTKNNTKENALLMADPTISAGWRDISERANFGNVYEWLHSSWLYNSDPYLHKEGLRRAALFGINIPKIMKTEISNFQERYRILNNIRTKMRNTYYQPSNKNFYKNLSENEKIDFFVFENKYLLNKPKGLEEIYKNKYFSIYK